MSRETEFTTITNPSTSYVGWKSNEKTFEFYNKEAKEKTLKQLPVNMILLKVAHGVGGWNDDLGSGIYSNIVTDLRTQELRVKCGDVTMESGLYSVIKDKIKASGARYETKVFALVEGQVVMISLKGAAAGAFMNFTKGNKKLVTNAITVASAVEGKKGAVTYHTPDFKSGKALTKKEAELANASYEEVLKYLDEVTTFVEPEVTVTAEELSVEADVVTPDVDDDLPF